MRRETRTPGQQIRDHRSARALSQGALAEQAEISRQATVSWVEGDGNTSLDVLQRLATALGRAIVILPGLPAPRPDRPGRRKST